MTRRFAEINAAGLVLRVIVAESLEWCEENLKGNWVETFKDGSERFNYASAGYRYDEEKDAFIPPKIFNSWILDESVYQWKPPTPMPDDGYFYSWNEETISWIQLEPHS